MHDFPIPLRSFSPWNWVRVVPFGLRGEARNVETRCEVDSHRVLFGSSVHRYRRALARGRGPGGGFQLLRGLRASVGFGLNPGRFPSPFRRGPGPRSTR
jgi:hypothetical protein